MDRLFRYTDLYNRVTKGTFLDPRKTFGRKCFHMMLSSIAANIYFGSGAIAQPAGIFEQYPSSPVALFQNINSLITSRTILKLDFNDDSKLQAVFGLSKISRVSFDHIISLSFEDIDKMGKENIRGNINELSPYHISIRATILNNKVTKVALDVNVNKPNALSSKEMSEIFSDGWYIRDVSYMLHPILPPPGVPPPTPVDEKQYSRLDHTTDTQVYAGFVVLSGTETLNSFNAVITESDQ